jgi:transcriptional/translational regulatory protein YebC/TACO1
MSKCGGNLGETGCVSWIFENRGYILVDKGSVDEDTLMGLTLEAGALDLRNDPDEDSYEVITMPEDLNKVKGALEKASIPFSLAEATMLPKNYIMLEGRNAEQMLKLIDTLEDNEDVQNVYANFNMADEVATKAGR